MTANASHPRTISRVLNGLLALALGAFVLSSFWPTVRLLDLWRADLQLQGSWIGGNAERITAVTPGGVANRAGLRPGDVLEFDPARDEDWVLAGYREVPEGFRASLPVLRADGSRILVTLTPERVAYLPTLNDQLAYLARLGGMSVSVLLGMFLVWAKPGLMTWCLFLGLCAGPPHRPWSDYFLAFGADPNSVLRDVAPLFLAPWIGAFVPFALSFPRNSMATRAPWIRALGLGIPGAAVVSLTLWNVAEYERAFVRDFPAGLAAAWTGVAVVGFLSAIAVMWRTYGNSEGSERARLKWALLGITGALMPFPIAIAFGVLPYLVSDAPSGSGLTAANWVFALCNGILLPLAFGVAVLRQRVVDIQFAVSRTLVYGAATTLVLVVLAAAHWIFGRLIEQSHLAFWLEGLAAIGLGLVLHRGTHTINGLVDRVVFRKHHAAEERLRRVTAALPFATEQRSIAEALVLEPVRNLNLASAALFYRESGEGPLQRVLAQGWDDEHATSLDADSLLVRYQQAEHAPLKLDDPQLLPGSVPDGAAQPVLALSIVNQHALTAMVLYGAHVNHTLLDPDEIELLHALAKAAATSHQQVRIAMLAKENAALVQETAAQQKIIERFEALVQTRMMGAGQGT